MTERIAVVGARAHPNLEIVREYVRSLPAGTVVISGGADGVDQAAADEAHKRLLPVREVLSQSPYYTIHSRRNGWQQHKNDLPEIRDRLLYRNTLIALDCDRMCVFPDGSKGGCWDCAREAVRFRRPVEVRWASGEVQPFSASMQRRIDAQRGQR